VMCRHDFTSPANGTTASFLLFLALSRFGRKERGSSVRHGRSIGRGSCSRSGWVGKPKQCGTVCDGPLGVGAISSKNFQSRPSAPDLFPRPTLRFEHPHQGGPSRMLGRLPLRARMHLRAGSYARPDESLERM